MRALALILMAIFACFCLAGFAQQGVAPSPATPAVTTPLEKQAAPTSGDHRVLLDVVVTDKSGTPVPGLQQQDFTILDDKLPENILSFHASDENTPADSPKIIFLMDAVNTSTQSVSYAREELEKFLRKDGGKLALPASLVIFTDKSTEMQPTSTRDGNSLANDLDSNQTGLRIIGRAQGFYGAVDRVELSIRTLEKFTAYEKTQPGRKLLIWISPGWPLLSGPQVELSTKNRESLFNTVVGLSKEMREARVTLYSIDPLGMADAAGPRTFFYENFLKGVRSADKVLNGDIALQVLATQSGGRVLNSSNDVTKLIANCLVDAKAYYTLSFDYPPADKANEYHSLEIKVNKPGLAARTRTGYYAQPYKTSGR